MPEQEIGRSIKRIMNVDVGPLAFQPQPERGGIGGQRRERPIGIVAGDDSADVLRAFVELDAALSQMRSSTRSISPA